MYLSTSEFCHNIYIKLVLKLSNELMSMVCLYESLLEQK